MKKIALHNLGCKVNSYETEAMQQLLEDEGYAIVPFSERADVYIINTCTVTNIADRKSRQMLHRAKKKNPDAVVVAVGCYVQAAKEELEADAAIDIVVGNNRKGNLVAILKEYEKTHALSEEVIDINQTNEYETLHIARTAEHSRAFIKVQDGCNQFCSYCIIPFARGRVRSRKPEEVIREVETLAENGYQEIVLTGIHLSSYGIDLEQKQGDGLLDLIRQLHSIDGIRRIRLGSLEPRIITDEFVKALKNMEKFCPHFHLSLQSGCGETLKRMNRRYTPGEYYEKCLLLREYFQNPSITTDVIVGFPQETEEEFEETRAFLKKVMFHEIHVFKYSKRAGTKAAEMDGQIPETIKAKRSSQLIELAKAMKSAYNRLFAGQAAEVLFEEEIMANGQRWLTGYTKEYIKIMVPVDEAKVHEISAVTLTGESIGEDLIAHCNGTNTKKLAEIQILS